MSEITRQEKIDFIRMVMELMWQHMSNEEINGMYNNCEQSFKLYQLQFLQNNNKEVIQ